MGLSGGGKSTSVSGSAQPWAKRIAEPAARQVVDVFNRNQPQLQEITQGVTSLLPGLSQSFQGWSPTTGQAQGYYGDVLSGKYLDPTNNPGLQSILDRTNRDVTGNVNSQFAGAGRYGSAAHTDVLSRNLAESEGAILADQYNRERAARDSAASTAPQLEASQLAQLLLASGLGADLPYTGTNALAGGLSALFGGGTQTQKGPGLLGNLLSAGAQVGSAALRASDRRLKENIEKVGEFDDGLGVYRWNYIWDEPETRQEGVMADEIEKFRPWALGPEIAGFATVDYSRL